MKFGLSFRKRLNTLTKMNKVKILNLLCLIIVSCTNQREIIKTTPTTFASDIMPNKFSVTSDGLIKFDIWHLSFLLPQDWDVNKYEFGIDSGYKIESYYFYGSEYSIGNGQKDYPTLTFLFHPIANNVEMGTYLKTLKNWTDDSAFKFIKTYSPKELGLNLDSAIAYKCQYQKNEMENITCYVIRAVYGNINVEIHMLSDTNIFEQVDEQFLETIKSISVEQ